MVVVTGFAAGPVTVTSTFALLPLMVTFPTLAVPDAAGVTGTETTSFWARDSNLEDNC